MSVGPSVSGARLPAVSARPVLQATVPTRNRITPPASATPQAGSVGTLTRLDNRTSAEPEERVVACQTLAYHPEEAHDHHDVHIEDASFATQASTEASTCSFSLCKDQNSVTIKANTNVKDSAGAIMKVLERLSSTMVVALQQEPSHEALNRAVKALAVCRKYLKDTHEDMELSFFPVYRSNMWGQPDPNLFSFLTFKSVLQSAQGEHQTEGQQASQPQDDKDMNLHVSSNSDTMALATSIVRTVVERGQAVLKAGGGCALFVAMTAVMHARQQLKAFHLTDIALVPQWITEDTRASLGRESKFLEFRILPSGMCNVMPGIEGAARQPAIRAVTALA